jgi:hypothetical protein
LPAASLWGTSALSGTVDGKAMLTGDCRNLGGRTYQDRNDNAGFRRFDRAAQSGL